MWESIKENIRHWVASYALRLAMRLEPDEIHHAIHLSFIRDMVEQGVVKIEFGFNEEGEPAIKVQTIDSLPRVTRH